MRRTTGRSLSYLIFRRRGHGPQNFVHGGIYVRKRQYLLGRINNHQIISRRQQLLLQPVALPYPAAEQVAPYGTLERALRHGYHYSGTVVPIACKTIFETGRIAIPALLQESRNIVFPAEPFTFGKTADDKAFHRSMTSVLQDKVLWPWPPKAPPWWGPSPLC